MEWFQCLLFVLACRGFAYWFGLVFIGLGVFFFIALAIQEQYNIYMWSLDEWMTWDQWMTCHKWMNDRWWVNECMPLWHPCFLSNMSGWSHVILSLITCHPPLSCHSLIQWSHVIHWSHAIESSACLARPDFFWLSIVRFVDLAQSQQRWVCLASGMLV